MTNIIQSDAIANGIEPGTLSMISGFFMSPGFCAVCMHRAAKRGSRLPLLGGMTSKIVWRISILLTGAEISIGATLGRGVCFPHPQGVVIGRDCHLGEHVTIYQNVTLGEKGRVPGYPSIGNNVTVYAGAVVGGGISVGDGAVVGAGSVVISDIPPHSTAVGVPARVLSNKTD